MDPLPLLFGLPLMVWFAFLAFLNLKHPERVWEAEVDFLTRKGRAVPAGPPPAFLTRTKRRGSAYAMMVVSTAAAFAYLAFDFHRLAARVR